MNSTKTIPQFERKATEYDSDVLLVHVVNSITARPR
jgi:hypothetical protein